MAARLTAGAVRIGDQMPPLVKGPITKLMIQKYACASGDFSQIHMDDEHARSAGLPGVIMHGMLSMAFLAQFVTDWLRDVEACQKLEVRFVGIVRPGDTLTCQGKVTDKVVRDGQTVVECEIALVNQRGEPVTTGKASAALSG